MPKSAFTIDPLQSLLPIVFAVQFPLNPPSMPPDVRFGIMYLRGTYTESSRKGGVRSEQTKTDLYLCESEHGGGHGRRAAEGLHRSQSAEGGRRHSQSAAGAGRAERGSAGAAAVRAKGARGAPRRGRGAGAPMPDAGLFPAGAERADIRTGTGVRLPSLLLSIKITRNFCVYPQKFLKLILTAALSGPNI